MKITLLFLILPLCFAASTTQEPCKKDIQDVLREMAAVSAEQMVEIHSLKGTVFCQGMRQENSVKKASTKR